MRSYGTFWLYTLLRFALFFALWGIVWLIGVPGLFAGLIALTLSAPLSWILLARPRRALAASIEARVENRKVRSQDLDARLAGAGDDPNGDTADHTPAAGDGHGLELAPGVTEAPPRDRTKRR